MIGDAAGHGRGQLLLSDRKRTRLNSSHGYISYAVFCLKKHDHWLPTYDGVESLLRGTPPDAHHPPLLATGSPDAGQSIPFLTTPHPQDITSLVRPHPAT